MTFIFIYRDDFERFTWQMILGTQFDWRICSEHMRFRVEDRTAADFPKVFRDFDKILVTFNPAGFYKFGFPAP